MLKKVLKLIILKVSNLIIFRNLLSHWAGNVSIFMLHNVVNKNEMLDRDNPNYPMYISKDKFIDFINEFIDEYKFISISQIFNQISEKKIKKAICLTFDDGYKNNLDIVLPIIEKYNIPITIYVCTKFLNGDCNAWWFELWDFINSKDTVSINFNYTKRIWKVKNTQKKLICYSEIKAFMMNLSLNEQIIFLSDLTKSKKRKNYNYLFLNWDDVIKLDKHPLVTIGAHTHSHPILKMENYDTAYKEIKKSKLLLEQKLGHSIEHLAYPFGSKNEAGYRDYKIVKKLNFKTAVTSLCHKPNIRYSLNLPRYGLVETESLYNINAKINGISNFLQRHLII